MTTTKPTALITGASKGFGLALAEALAQRGWKLIINARNAAALLKAQRTLEQFTEVTAISGDVRDEIHLLQFAEKLAQLNWRLDLIINNASTSAHHLSPLLLEYENETIHQIFHTNVLHLFRCSRKLKHSYHLPLRSST
jgi:NAD(P)-dependent dehydrogenase (short-subunit alcohol dehydrogenase family)